MGHGVAIKTARSLEMADVLFVYWGNGLRLSYEPECMAGEAEDVGVTEKGDRHGVGVPSAIHRGCARVSGRQVDYSIKY